MSSASPTTQYVYDLDRKLKTLTRPDGVTLTYGYDSAGRLQTSTMPQGTITLAYNATTGQLQSSTAPSGEAIAYAFDGFLKTGETWSGPVPGSLSLGFDNNFRMTSQTVNGTALGFSYDLDGLITGAGALTLTRDAQNGRLTGSTLGSVTDTYNYDANGLFASYTAAFSGTTLYSEAVLRDAVGRITQKTETVQGTTHVWGYTFDAAGRLTDVTKDSNFFSHYGYDGDDNRTTYTNTTGTVNPTYDAQDRLTAYGSTTYGYTLNGELTSKTVGGQVTSYTYDPLGNLLHVGPPSGSAIDYVVDGENRRVGKKLGGTLSQGFLYQDALNVVAQFDGGGSLVGRYVFGSRPNVPDYFTTSAGTFRILSDHLGSPRLLVNTSSGAVVEQIDYDEFGNVTNDTSPGLTPFGFAGGVYDKDAGLVRFGARDYDASTGRWTSKDPPRFEGGFNLYAFVGNDPINGIDPWACSFCRLIRPVWGPIGRRIRRIRTRTGVAGVIRAATASISILEIRAEIRNPIGTSAEKTSIVNRGQKFLIRLRSARNQIRARPLRTTPSRVRLPTLVAATVRCPCCLCLSRLRVGTVAELWTSLRLGPRDVIGTLCPSY